MNKVIVKHYEADKKIRKQQKNARYDKEKVLEKKQEKLAIIKTNLRANEQERKERLDKVA